MNQRTQRRPIGRGAYGAELSQIEIWTHDNQRYWFTSSNVNIHSRMLNAMAKRHLIRTVGRIGNKQAYALRSGDG